MPPTATADTEIRKGSFADSAGDDVTDNPSQNEAADRAAEEAASKAAAEKASADKAAADKLAADEKAKADAVTEKKDKVDDDNLNPNLTAPKKEEKKEAVTDDEIPAEQLKGMTTEAANKAKESWKTIKQAEKAALAQAAEATIKATELEKQLTQLKATGGNIEKITKENEDLKARIAEYENELAISRVESTKEFKFQVAGPLKATEEAAKAIAAKYELSSPSILLDALREPDASKRNDLLEDLSADFKMADRMELIDMGKRYAAANQVAEELRKNAGAKLAELTDAQQREADRIATENSHVYRGSVVESMKSLQERYPILRPQEGADKWNAYLDAERQAVEKVNVNDLPVQDVAQALVAARMLPQIAAASTHFEKKSKELAAKLDEAEKRIKEYVATAPGAGGGRTVQDGTGAPAKSGSFIDSFDS